MFNLNAKNKLILFSCALLISFLLGWRAHSWKTDAGLARSIGKAQKTADIAQKNIDPVIEQKQNEIVRTEYVYKTIREKINETDDQRICFADTNAWSLYNSAITGTPPLGSEPAGKAAGNDNASGVAGDGGQAPQIVATVEQVLNNATDNYETCRKNAIKHNALIDAVMEIKDKMCVCQSP